jgi:hypothetical protein
MGYLMMLSASRLFSVIWYDDKWAGKDLEGSSHVLIETMSCVHLDGMRKTMKNLNKDSWYPGQYSNQAPPKYKFTALLLDQPVQ